MAAKKQQSIDDAFDFDQLKDQVLQLLTGQDGDSKKEMDYVALVTRVTVILVAIYGVSRVRLLRQLAVSIATTAFTKWMAKKATGDDAGSPAPHAASASPKRKRGLA